MNILFAVLLAIMAIISMVGNPAVFLYNYFQPLNGASVLFKILAVCDFLTNITRPFLVIPKLLEPGLPPIMMPSTLLKVNL